MKNEINLYIVLMALSIPLQYIAYTLLPEVSLTEFVFEGEFAGSATELSEYLAILFVTLIFHASPGILTAIWINRIKSLSIEYRWAWMILGLFLEYFILLFYISASIFENRINSEERV